MQNLGGNRVHYGQLENSQFAHLIKSTVNNFGVQSSASALAETDKICVYSSF